MKFVNGKLLAIITSSLKFQWISASKLILCFAAHTMRVVFVYYGQQRSVSIDLDSLRNHLRKNGQIFFFLVRFVCFNRLQQNLNIPFTNVALNERGQQQQQQQPETIRSVLRKNFINIESWLSWRAKYGRAAVVGWWWRWWTAKEKCSRKHLSCDTKRYLQRGFPRWKTLLCAQAHTHKSSVNEWIDGSVWFFLLLLHSCRLCCYFGFCSCCSRYFLRCRLAACSSLFFYRTLFFIASVWCCDYRSVPLPITGYSFISYALHNIHCNKQFPSVDKGVCRCVNRLYLLTKIYIHIWYLIALPSFPSFYLWHRLTMVYTTKLDVRCVLLTDCCLLHVYWCVLLDVSVSTSFSGFIYAMLNGSRLQYMRKMHCISDNFVFFGMFPRCNI